uniref:Uncharacterized protein n=1 Tax=Anguilla anguilla TaxID=7936 RepID=A0A0E9UH10_ANGAN
MISEHLDIICPSRSQFNFGLNFYFNTKV